MSGEPLAVDVARKWMIDAAEVADMAIQVRMACGKPVSLHDGAQLEARVARQRLMFKPWTFVAALDDRGRVEREKIAYWIEQNILREVAQ
ncbi:MAG: hypothetical protein NXI32_04890 [bacterium]|nr:hypothetical protein [bacterium]